MFFLFLITVVYGWFLLKFLRQTIEAIKRKNEMEALYLSKDVILNVPFSSKAKNWHDNIGIISFILLGALWLYSIAGAREVADLLDIKKSTCKFLHFITVICFSISACATIYYAWISAGVSGQSLIVKNDKMRGIACVIEKLSIYHIEFDIALKEVKEVFYLNGERTLGINPSSLVIITDKDRYEYIMPVDGEATKRIIENKIK